MHGWFVAAVAAAGLCKVVLLRFALVVDRVDARARGLFPRFHVYRRVPTCTDVYRCVLTCLPVSVCP